MAHLTPLMLNVAGAVVALSLGPWQFVRRLRSRRPRVHRVVGRVYVVAVLATGVGGLMLAPTTYTGRLYFFWMGLCASLAVMTLLSLPMEAFHRRMLALGFLAVLFAAVPQLWRIGMLNLFYGWYRMFSEHVTSTLRNVLGRREGHDQLEARKSAQG